MSQTYQDLQPDYNEITAAKVAEVADLIRATLGHTGSAGDVKHAPSDSSFSPETVSVWVNGLWFTSLALSLTTALLAVLTKQWIHQYMAVPSGTPRDRSRIRQLRFMNLRTWHVPVIISLLPLLMHIALGVFFIGLIVLLKSLHSTICAIVGTVASIGFSAYFGTTILPLVDPDCPYKTPLTIYAHALWMSCRKSPVPIEDDFPHVPGTRIIVPPLPKSLADVERAKVWADTGELDAQCLSWLYNTSSNSTVQRVVMSAYSVLPIMHTSTVQNNIPSFEDAISQAIRYADAIFTERRDLNNSLVRAFYRTKNGERLCWKPHTDDPRSLHVLLQAEHRSDAIALLQEQIVTPMALRFSDSDFEDTVEHHDYVTWAAIFQNASSEGVDWLQIHDPDSQIWKPLLRQISRLTHTCRNCEHGERTIFKRLRLVDWLPPKQQRLRAMLPNTDIRFELPVPHEAGENPLPFVQSMVCYAFPFFCDVLWRFAYPTSSFREFELPPDIGFQFDLLCEVYVQRDEHLAHGMLDSVRTYLEMLPANQSITTKHPRLFEAIFALALKIISSEGFLELEVDYFFKRDILHVLTRLVLIEPAYNKGLPAWLTTPIVNTITGIAVPSPSSLQILPAPVLSDLFEVATTLKNRSLLTAIYSALLERRDWLSDLDRYGRMYPPGDREDEDEDLKETDYTQCIPWFMCSYVDGLSALASVDKGCYDRVTSHLRDNANDLDILSKWVLLSNSCKRKSVVTLAHHVGEAVWRECSARLKEFLEEHDAYDLYVQHSWTDPRHNLYGYIPDHPFRVLGCHGVGYGTFHDLGDLLAYTDDTWQSTTSRTCGHCTVIARAKVSRMPCSIKLLLI